MFIPFSSCDYIKQPTRQFSCLAETITANAERIHEFFDKREEHVDRFSEIINLLSVHANGFNKNGK